MSGSNESVLQIQIQFTGVGRDSSSVHHGQTGAVEEAGQVPARGIAQPWAGRLLNDFQN